jgi:hypothetical protein
MAKVEQEVLWDFADELGNNVIETLETVKAAGKTAGVSELAKSGFEEPVGVAADKSVGPSTQSASANIEAGEMCDEYIQRCPISRQSRLSLGLRVELGILSMLLQQPSL